MLLGGVSARNTERWICMVSELEKRAWVEILNMMVDYEVSLGDEMDCDFIAETTTLILKIEGRLPDPKEVEKSKQKLIKLMEERWKEWENGGNKNNQNT